MKKTYRIIKIIAAALALAMVAALAACSIPGSDKEMQVAGLTITVPSEMFIYDENDGIEPDAVAKDFKPVYSSDVSFLMKYFYEILGKNFSLNLVQYPAAIFQYDGKGIDEFIERAKSLRMHGKYNLKQSGDLKYYEYTCHDYFGGGSFFATDYFVEIGNYYYCFEFYAADSTSDKYRDKYEKIIRSAKYTDEVPETRTIQKEKVKLSVPGSFVLEDEFKQVCPFKNDSPRFSGTKDYAISIIDASQIEKGTFDKHLKRVLSKDYTKLDDDTAICEDKFSERIIEYEYIHAVGDYLVYIKFRTPKPADDALKAEFMKIVKSAEIVAQ